MRTDSVGLAASAVIGTLEAIVALSVTVLAAVSSSCHFGRGCHCHCYRYVTALVHVPVVTVVAAAATDRIATPRILIRIVPYTIVVTFERLDFIYQN